MSTMTEHYGLEMPLGSDYYDINVQNQNMEAVDAALWGLDEGKVGQEDKGKAGGIASLDSGGQLPYAQTPHLTSSVTLYVNASTGDDSNPGTQSKPFKTIQAAINSLPKDLGVTAATINVANGNYQEDILISGFYGGSYPGLSIVGIQNTINESAIVKSIRIFGCSTKVILNGLYINGVYSGISVAITASRALLQYLYVDITVGYGIVVGDQISADALLVNCNINGATLVGLLSHNGGTAVVGGGTISNCGIGVSAGSNSSGTPGIAFRSSQNVAFSGNTVNSAAYYNGQIWGF